MPHHIWLVRPIGLVAQLLICNTLGNAGGTVQSKPAVAGAACTPSETAPGRTGHSLRLVAPEEPFSAMPVGSHGRDIRKWLMSKASRMRVTALLCAD